MIRVFVCNECAPELFLDTPTSLGYHLRNVGRCHHVDELIEAEIAKAKASEAHQSAKCECGQGKPMCPLHGQLKCGEYHPQTNVVCMMAAAHGGDHDWAVQGNRETHQADKR